MSLAVKMVILLLIVGFKKCSSLLINLFCSNMDISSKKKKAHCLIFYLFIVNF